MNKYLRENRQIGERSGRRLLRRGRRKLKPEFKKQRTWGSVKASTVKLLALWCSTYNIRNGDCIDAMSDFCRNNPAFKLPTDTKKEIERKLIPSRP